MRIFIPTRDRINAQFTWDNLARSSALEGCVTLVAPPEEAQTHRDRGRAVLERPPLPLAGVRQWLVDEAVREGRGREPIIMLDDDLAFFVRKERTAHNLRPADDWDVYQIMGRLHCLVAGGSPEGMGGPEIEKPVVHAGLSPRQGNNWSFPNEVEFNTRVNAVHCVLPDALHHYGIRYDDMMMMEDYHVTLSLFENGEGNAALTDAAWDQCRGSGAAGGFSHYRNPERQKAAAEKLAELHPLSVKTTLKKPKTGAGGFAGERVDVRVQWKQAFKKRHSESTFTR